MGLMNLYISDTHFGHRNVINFDRRPFADINQMNYTIMALECLEFLIKEITDVSIEELDEEMLDNLVTWQYNASKSTIDEFRELDSETKQDVIDFIKEFLIYEEMSVNDKDYLLILALFTGIIII